MTQAHVHPHHKDEAAKAAGFYDDWEEAMQSNDAPTSFILAHAQDIANLEAANNRLAEIDRTADRVDIGPIQALSMIRRIASGHTPSPCPGCAEQIADTPGASLLSEEAAFRQLSLLYNYDEASDAPQFTRWQMLVAMQHGAGLSCPSCEANEANAIADIADMMANHVENWPAPKKLKTAIALIDKTLTAALKDTVPRDVAESWKARADNKTADCAAKDEAMEAFKADVSDTLIRWYSGRNVPAAFSDFIIPPADPVAEALKAALAAYMADQDEDSRADRFTAALAELKSRLPLGGA